MSAPVTAYLVARAGANVFIRSTGLANMKSAPMLDAFLTSEIEQGAIPDLAGLVEHEPNGPNLLRLQRSLSTKLAPSVPCRARVDWIKCGVSHCLSPLAGSGQRRNA